MLMKRWLALRGFAVILLTALPSCSLTVTPTYDAPTATPAILTTIAPSSTPPFVSLEPPLALVGRPQGKLAVANIVDTVSGEIRQTLTLSNLDLAYGWSNSTVVQQYVFYQTPDSGRRLGMNGDVLDLPFLEMSDQFLPSPDGSQVAWSGCDWVGDPGAACRTWIQIISVIGGTGKLLVDRTLDEPVQLIPVHWSSDERYLYFSSFVPIAEGGWFGGYSGLERVDLDTGDFIDILQDRYFFDVAFSPDDTLLAFAAPPTQPGALPQIVLHSIGEGQDLQAGNLESRSQAGDLIWSPDSRNILYTMVSGGMPNETFAIVDLDVGTFSQRVLIRDGQQHPRTKAWLSARQALIADDDSRIAWTLDVATGQKSFLANGQFLGLVPAEFVLPSPNSSSP